MRDATKLTTLNLSLDKVEEKIAIGPASTWRILGDVADSSGRRLTGPLKKNDWDNRN